jgi:hypothetical protein
MLTKHFFPDVHILPHSAVPNMMKAFNDETFELDKHVSDLGLQVFRQIEQRNGVYDELVSLLPPLPGVASNAADDFIEPFSIEPSSIELSSIERNVHRVDQFENVRLHRASSVHNHFRTSIGSIIKQFQISAEFIVANQSGFEASSGISMSGKDFDGYYLLCLLFVCSYHFEVVLAHNALILHIYTMTMAMKHALMHKLFIGSLVDGLSSSTLFFRLPARCWNKSNLFELLSSNKNDSPLHIHLTIFLYIPGLDPSATEKTKQQLGDSNSYIFEEFYPNCGI